MDVPRNVVMEGDALRVLRSLPDGCVDAFWASPPYNLDDPFRDGRGRRAGVYRYEAGGTSRGDGSVRSEAAYQAEQVEVLTEWHRLLQPNGVAFYSHKVRIKGGRAISPLEWIYRTPLVVLQELVWDRGGTPQVDTCRFLPVSERVYVLTRRPYVKLANRERLPDVLRVPPTHHRRRVSGHPCPTPPALVRACLSVLPRERETERPLVVDCYAGTGTTGVVARELGMDYLLIERAPAYVALCRARLEGPAVWLMPLGPAQQPATTPEMEAAG